MLSVVELTRTTPNVEEALHALRGEGLVLGLVTVTDATHIDVAV
ncbi:MAG TPA: hypothetical protein VN635_01295 [Conexibacter sp.]|nr:hypothetical protein [Conexibacter sp.]